MIEMGDLIRIIPRERTLNPDVQTDYPEEWYDVIGFVLNVYTVYDGVLLKIFHPNPPPGWERIYNWGVHEIEKVC